MPFIANNSQQDDLIAEFTNFSDFYIAGSIVGPAWKHKKTGAAQMPLKKCKLPNEECCSIIPFLSSIFLDSSAGLAKRNVL
ncbi:MAG: hypothetical protein C4B58_16340 [Deltaproteobacteria bacterium]|nr:MAG: hypothetical protein C4B58_16340 [Deltaproteobacteria bacterium]